MCMIVYVDGLVFLVIVVSNFHSAKISSYKVCVCVRRRFVFAVRRISLSFVLYNCALIAFRLDCVTKL